MAKKNPKSNGIFLILPFARYVSLVNANVIEEGKGAKEEACERKGCRGRS